MVERFLNLVANATYSQRVCKHDDMRKILAYLKDNYRHKYKQVGLWMMACGTPNVGKSSIINQIRSISDLENKKANAKA